MSNLLRKFLALPIVFALSGCGGEEATTPDLPPRAIKYMKLDALAEFDTRQLAGIVKAGTSANVAFEINGNVIVMAKKVGEAVRKGDIIAQLDPKPIELKVEQAEFARKQAEATLRDARSKLAQTQELWEKEFSTLTALDTAKANFANAEGQVGITTSQLASSKRDLEKTSLKAPFDGRVSKRQVEVFEEVKAGSAIYTLQTQGENEVEVSVPETLIGVIRLGLEVDVKFSPVSDALIKGLVTEIAPEAGDANSFPVTIRLENSPQNLRPGMSAQVIVSFKSEATGKAYMVPVGALKPNIETNQATVFVFDPEAKKVRQKAVKVVGASGNNLEIIGEIAAGDIIATAGVGQMHDGMEVRLLDFNKSF